MEVGIDESNALSTCK